MVGYVEYAYCVLGEFVNQWLFLKSFKARNAGQILLLCKAGNWRIYNWNSGSTLWCYVLVIIRFLGDTTISDKELSLGKFKLIAFNDFWQFF